MKKLKTAAMLLITAGLTVIAMGCASAPKAAGDSGKADWSANLLTNGVITSYSIHYTKLYENVKGCPKRLPQGDGKAPGTSRLPGAFFHYQLSPYPKGKRGS